MTSDIQSRSIGISLALGPAASGDGLPGADRPETRGFGAILRDLDAAGEPTEDKAEPGAAPGQLAAMAGNIVPLANPIALPGGNSLPTGSNEPGSLGTVLEGKARPVFGPGAIINVAAPATTLEAVPPGQVDATGLQSAETLFPPNMPSAATPADRAVTPGGGTTETAIAGQEVSPPAAGDPQSVVADTVELQPDVEPADGRQPDDSLPQQKSTGPEQAQGGNAAVSVGDTPARIAAALKDFASQGAASSPNGEGAALSTEPADRTIRPHASEHSPPPFARAGGEFATTGISRALATPASPHLAEALEKLVERLVDARDRVREVRGELALRHAEFGLVRAQIVDRVEALQIALSSRDPDFAPSVQAALSERMPHSQSQHSASSNGHRDQGPPNGQSERDRPPETAGAAHRPVLADEPTTTGRKSGLFA